MASSSAGIQKKIINAGKGKLSNFVDGTKLYFHYQTRKCDDSHTVIDDSKKDEDKKPMQIVTGKKFKLEVWEACLTTMLCGEVASFVVEPFLCVSYPLVSKNLRDIRNKKLDGHQHVHHCGMAMKEQGLGYDDLDQLMKEPQKLEFILEVVQIQEAGEYEKDTWAMSVEEKLEQVPILKEYGNTLFKEKKYQEAADVYAKAIGLLEQLLLREKPGDEAYVDLDMKKVPLLLNYSQCKLFLGEYYQVIEHTSEVLKKDPENVKAYFRRAKAHIGAWNPDDAKNDFLQAARLDPTVSITKELKNLELKIKEKEKADRSKLEGKLF